MGYYNSFGSKSGSLKNCFGPDKRLPRKTLINKKSAFRRDPLVVLTYFVLLGVLVSGFASFGL